MTLVYQSQIDLVNEGSWLECVTDALAFELTAGDPSKLGIDERQ
jgi:hypothetical protein